MTLEINLPDVHAEVSAVFARYEEALVTNQRAVLDELFWNSPHTLRYGFSENHYGHADIRAFRASLPVQSPPRELLRTVITTYGRDFATANTEYQREGEATTGRETKTLMRTEHGWRIVSAHASLLGVTV